MSARILIVDDDATICLLLSDILKVLGYTPISVQTCAEGIAFLEEHDPPDLVLLDLALPDGVGWVVHSAMQEVPAWSRIPTIIVTGNLTNVPPDVSWTPGQLTCLEKPFSVKRLKRTIAENLAAQQVRVPAEQVA